MLIMHRSLGYKILEKNIGFRLYELQILRLQPNKGNWKIKYPWILISGPGLVQRTVHGTLFSLQLVQKRLRTRQNRLKLFRNRSELQNQIHQRRQSWIGPCKLTTDRQFLILFNELLDHQSYIYYIDNLCRQWFSTYRTSLTFRCPFIGLLITQRIFRRKYDCIPIEYFALC